MQWVCFTGKYLDTKNICKLVKIFEPQRNPTCSLKLHKKDKDL